MTEFELEERARLEKNRYLREWRAKNRDKVKAQNARYWKRRALQGERKEVSSGAKG